MRVLSGFETKERQVMLSKEIIRIVASGVGLASVAAFVYLAGPFVAIGGFRPLENAIVRDVTVVLLVAAAAGVTGFGFFRRKKKSAEIAKGITEAGKAESDAEVLAERMKDALATLRLAGQGKGDVLYDLPWYLLIGPPGTGKTTALVNSGLKFPLARGATPAALAGVGGTRYCDWWFAEDAVLIDTAGRYTTQDSDAEADQKSWLAFLDLLKKNRPRQPINGVIVAIALDDIMTGNPATTAAHAGAIRARLLELHRRLKVDFPVYALFTKADLVLGFREFFGNLGEQPRRQVWGATFQTGDKTRNLVGEVPAEFDLLIARLYEMTTDRLQDEPVPATRVALFGFPAQMAALKKPVFDFLNQIFEPTRYHANATLRGFYFTSATQHGTPIDQLIAGLSRSFGAREVAPRVYSGRGQSFFLTRLLGELIVGEAAWVSTDRAAVLRARLLKAVAVGALLLVAAAASLAWWTSYGRNKLLIDETIVAAADYRTAAGELARETTISDRDLAKILPALNKLRYLPAGYATRDEAQPLLATFGLGQKERLESTATRAYATGLERMLRPRLLYRLEEQLEANRTNTSFLYDGLKAYLMLGGLHATDREFLLGWLRRDFAENLYPGAANADGRKLLEDHVVAMLDLSQGTEPLVTLNGSLVADAQAALARLGIAERAYELLRSRATTGATVEDWNAADAGGPDAALVFEGEKGQALESIRVPGFYTYAGFRRSFMDRLPGIAERLKEDRWVLGSAGEQGAVEAQYAALSSDLLDLYEKDFTTAWRTALAKLRMKRLNADKPKYIALAAASAATSPIKQIAESIRDETALTRERPGFAKPAADDPAAASLTRDREKAPGADIEQAFKPYQVLVEGDAGRRPIDAVVANLAELYQSLLMGADPSRAQLANAQVQTQVAALRGNANRLPQPFAAMLQGASSDFDNDLTNSMRAQLARALGDQVTGICQQIAANRYPFARTDREVALVDFGKLFGPQGIMDKFFTSQLAQYTDTSKREWAFRKDSAIGRSLASSTGTLREFQRAAQIRETFFATGGLVPSMILTVVPPPLPVTATTAAATPVAAGAPVPSLSIKLDINGTLVTSVPGASPPSVVQWPGAATNRSAITVASDVPGQQPATIERSGPWSLFRLVEAGAPVARGDKIIVNYIVGGRTLTYQIGAGSGQNPFTLPALREFRCPTSL